MPTLPFKLNQDRRHHVPRQRRKVTNWHDYDASLRQRGSLAVWFTAKAIEGWRAEPRTTPGGQPWYDGELQADITRRFLWTLNRMLRRGAVTKEGWGAPAGQASVE